MALNYKVLRGSAVLSLNEVVSNGCSFVRNYILARVLSKGDFGVAAMLTVTFLFLEVTSKMAFGQLVISSQNGGDRRFVNTEHTVQMFLGMCSAVVFLSLARPLAEVLAVPQLADGMRLLALVPACMAFINLGAFTYAREMHFERSVCIEAIPQILITLAAWPVALWLRDFRAFIWLQIGKAALSTLVSNVVGGRSYACAFRKDYCREIFNFSWPLVVSGFIMICSSQGDRLLMTRAFDLKELGTYAVAWSFAATPGIAILKIVGGTALPMMARVADEHERLRARYALLAQIFSLGGTLFALGLVIGGEQIMTLLFRGKYTGAGIIAGWISCGQAVRIIRGAPIGVAWGRNETGSQMLGNIVRLAGLLLVIPVVLLHGSLIWVAVAGLVGEILALVVNVVAVRRLHRMEMWLCFGPALVGTACLGLGAGVANGLMPGRGYVLTAVLLITMFGLTLVVFAKAFPEVGHELGKIRTAVESRIRRQPVIPSPRADG